MNHESRPQAASADSTPIKSLDTSVPSNKLAELAIGRRSWARRYIERRTAFIAYGSTEWLMLPTDHPDKIAACVVAAECWASNGDTLEADLRREIELLRAAHKRREDEEYQLNAQAHRDRYGHASVVRSFVDRRTDQIAAAMPQADDHPGGPVEPWGDGA